MDHKLEIISILENHVGKENAITVAEIASILGIGEGKTNPATRMEIRQIISEAKLPIGSCGNGYFIIDSYNELREYVRSLNSRIQGINFRIGSVRSAFWHMNRKKRDEPKKRKIKRRKT